MSVLTPVSARVSGDLILQAAPAKCVERLHRKLSFPNPKFVRAKRMGFWTGTEPERIEAITEMPDGSVHIPRGAIAIVREQLLKDNYAVHVDSDERTAGSPIVARVPSLRDYQSETVGKLIKHTQGLVVLPCGCGKTRAGVGAIANLARTALVIVPTGELADQWLDALRANISIQAGLVGSGRCERDAPVVVAIDDSLLPLLERDPQWGKRFGVCIVDEAHHAPAKTMRSILSLVPARWRLGLSATPEREDGLGRLVEWSFGSRLIERTTQEMIFFGWLMPASVELVETGFRYEHEGNEKTRIVGLERALIADLSRNVLIAERAAHEARQGETVLVLSNRREHTAELADLIGCRGVEAVALTSSSGKRKRKEAIVGLREGKLPVLIATSLADEGLDVARLSRVLLAFPHRARGGTLQRLGRLLRQFPGKKPLLIDFVDDLVPTLANRTKARKRVYRDLGFLH